MPYADTEKLNPLGFYCPPNGATPDYISTWPIEDFLGYGLLLCHSDLREDSFSLHEVMGPGTVTALRERFLDIVEDLILYIYEGIVDVPCSGFDSDQFDSDNEVLVSKWREGDPNHDQEAEEEVALFWFPDFIDVEGTIALSFNCEQRLGEFCGGDSHTIWLGRDAYLNPVEVRAALTNARKAIGVTPNEYRRGETEPAWTKVIVSYEAGTLLVPGQDNAVESPFTVDVDGWNETWQGPMWHVFNGKCQVAGPYRTMAEAESVKKEMNENDHET